MCLERVLSPKELARFRPVREGNHQVGWKEFLGKSRSAFCGKERAKPLNTWLKEKDWRDKKDWDPGDRYDQGHIRGWGDVHYKTGFHIYLTRTGRDSRTRTKVYYRNIVAIGYQNGEKVVVAKEIFIPKENKP